MTHKLPISTRYQLLQALRRANGEDGASIGAACLALNILGHDRLALQIEFSSRLLIEALRKYRAALDAADAKADHGVQGILAICEQFAPSAELEQEHAAYKLRRAEFAAHKPEISAIADQLEADISREDPGYILRQAEDQIIF